MVRQYHQLDGHELEQTLGVGDGQEAWRAAVHEVVKSWTKPHAKSELIGKDPDAEKN